MTTKLVAWLLFTQKVFNAPKEHIPTRQASVVLYYFFMVKGVNETSQSRPSGHGEGDLGEVGEWASCILTNSVKHIASTVSHRFPERPWYDSSRAGHSYQSMGLLSLSAPAYMGLELVWSTNAYVLVFCVRLSYTCKVFCQSEYISITAAVYRKEQRNAEGFLQIWGQRG